MSDISIEVKWPETFKRLPNWILATYVILFCFLLLLLYWKIILSNTTISLGGVATLILAFFYIRQTEILSKQAETQQMQVEIQKKQLNLQHNPSISLKRLDYRGKNKIICHMENVGNDIAKDIHLVCHGFVVSGQERIPINETEVFESDSEKFSITPLARPLHSINNKDLSKAVHLEGDVLKSGIIEQYECYPAFYKISDLENDSSKRSLELPHVIENFDDLEYNHITFQLSLVYRSATDEININILGQLSIHFSEVEYMADLEDNSYSIDIGTGGSPENGEWSIVEAFERGTFINGGFTAFVTSEEVKQQISEGLIDVFDD
jgi:hypothetical protein